MRFQACFLRTISCCFSRYRSCGGSGRRSGNLHRRITANLHQCLSQAVSRMYLHQLFVETLYPVHTRVTTVYSTHTALVHIASQYVLLCLETPDIHVQSTITVSTSRQLITMTSDERQCNVTSVLTLTWNQSATW